MRDQDKSTVAWLRGLAWFSLVCEIIGGICMGIAINEFPRYFRNPGIDIAYVVIGVFFGVCIWAILLGFASIVENISVSRWGEDPVQESTIPSQPRPVSGASGV